MNFANVKAITIPEGDVKSIAIGGVTVWQKPNPLPYDAEVDYVESTGAQWVDSGVPVKPTTRIVAAINLTQNNVQQRLFGVNEGSGKIYDAYINNSKNWAARLFVSSAPGILGATYGPSYLYQFDVNPNTATVTISSVTQNYTDMTPFDSSPNTIPIFARRNTGTVAYLDYPAYMRLREFKVYEGANSENLVRDFVPVRVGTAGYLYDRANPTGGPSGNGLYGSETATPLVAGPDKNGGAA